MNTLKQLVDKFINNDCYLLDADELKQKISSTKDQKQLKRLAKLIIENCFSCSKIAIPMIKRLLEIDSEDLEANIVLGWLLWMEGENDDCISLLNKVKKNR